MNKINLICNQCDGNIIFNSKTHRGYCESCGREYLFTPENITEDPEMTGYNFQRGVNRANAEYNALHSKQSVNSKPTPTPAPKKESTGTVVIIVLAIIIFTNIIVPSLVSFSINSMKTSIRKNDSEYEPSSSASHTTSNYEKYDVDVVSTTEQERPKWIYLTDLTPYSGNPFNDESNSKDIFGNSYICGFSGRIGTDKYAIWRLDQQYSRLTLTYAIPERDRGCNPQKTSTIRIYSDDLVVFETQMTSLSDSQQITIDVSQTRDLKIQIIGDNGSWLTPAIFDPILYTDDF